MRLDRYISEKKQMSRNKSQALIKSGCVLVDWKTVTKVGLLLKQTECIEIWECEEVKYVARSALKLKWFLENDDLDLENKVCLDIWSSTWWFCQVLLENDVAKIFAVDVGSSQLHEKIRNNQKIISLENTDIRKLNKLENNIDIITCDVSFISLDLIIDSIISHMNNDTVSILLFKPQFEVWRQCINKKWVVKDKKKIEKRFKEFLDNLRLKWLKILKVEDSKLDWENWNKEIVVKVRKNS